MPSDTTNSSFHSSYWRRVLSPPSRRRPASPLPSSPSLPARPARSPDPNELVAESSHSFTGNESRRRLPLRWRDARLSTEPVPSRYKIEKHIGQGSMGQVLLAFDTELGRHVAVKVPLPDGAEDKLLVQALKQEARLTATLEHPNIVPVYDVLRTDQPGYVMRRVAGVRLAEILGDLKRGLTGRLDEYGRVRLLTIFLQVVAAVAYAHKSRIIHRDLKPNNIMIGEFGEVLVLDWGLARNLTGETFGSAGRDFLDSSNGFVGAPAYISPEQLNGQDAQVDERSDIYSLGAILYELLTFQPPYVPFPSENELAFVARIQRENIRAPSLLAAERNIPPFLDEICMRCLASEPTQRYANAMDIHRDVALHLEGTRQQQWRQRAAEERTQEAALATQRYLQKREEALTCRKQADAELCRVRPWDGVEVKRHGWNSERLAIKREEEALDAFTEAEKLYNQALSHDKQYVPAIHGLTDLYWQRFLQAEQSRNTSEMRYFDVRVRTLDVHNVYASRLKGDGLVRFRSQPDGAAVTLYVYREHDRILRPVEPRLLGRCPLDVTLGVGSYLAVLNLPPYVDVRFPIFINRLEKADALIHFYTQQEIGPDFVYIPGGPFRAGADREASRPDVEIVTLTDFAIGRYPIRVFEYLEFLNDIGPAQPAKALSHAPRRVQDMDPLWKQLPDGRFAIPHGPDEDGHYWHPELPILLINWDDANAYATWRAQRDNKPYRLPTALEWEKAARGVDGRFYPWGDHFDATYCRNRESRKEPAQLEPVGAYATDESPYGVRDLAGGVADWGLDVYGADSGMRVMLGGSWTRHEVTCRAARRTGLPQTSTNSALGFRLCVPLEQDSEGLGKPPVIAVLARAT